MPAENDGESRFCRRCASHLEMPVVSIVGKFGGEALRCGSSGGHRLYSWVVVDTERDVVLMSARSDGELTPPGAVTL